MSILERISTLLTTDIKILMGLVDGPEREMDQEIIELRDRFYKERRQVALAIADEKRLKLNFEQEIEKAKEWEKRTKEAEQSGREDLAREARHLMAEYQEIAKQHKAQWQDQKKKIARLKEALTMLNEKILEASRKRNELILQTRLDEAERWTQEFQNRLDSMNVNAIDRVAQAEHKVTHGEAELARQCSSSSRSSNSADVWNHALAQLESNLRQMEAELQTRGQQIRAKNLVIEQQARAQVRQNIQTLLTTIIKLWENLELHQMDLGESVAACKIAGEQLIIAMRHPFGERQSKLNETGQLTDEVNDFAQQLGNLVKQETVQGKQWKEKSHQHRDIS
ncbi:MAG: hypothetical protein CL940_11955 [Deltaproteobacteria bacterium]|nr:hypothetical protein [Deltaproteobacteria bacterium]